MERNIWFKILDANRRFADAENSMFEENNPDAACTCIRSHPVRMFNAYEGKAQRGTAQHRPALRCCAELIRAS